MKTSTVKELIEAAKEGKTVKCNHSNCKDVVGKSYLLREESSYYLFRGKVMHEGCDCAFVLLKLFCPPLPKYYSPSDRLDIEILD